MEIVAEGVAQLIQAFWERLQSAGYLVAPELDQLDESCFLLVCQNDWPAYSYRLERGDDRLGGVKVADLVEQLL